MAALAVLISVLCLLRLASGQCETVTSPLREFCPFYNYTSLDEANQVQAAASIDHFKPLFLSNCSTLSNIFICASYSPFCHPPNYRLLPCRELCFYVYSSCIHVFSSSRMPWPSRLNFHKLLSSTISTWIMLITDTAAASFHFNVSTVFYLCTAVPSNTFFSWAKYFSYYSVRQDAQLTKKNSVPCTWPGR